MKNSESPTPEQIEEAIITSSEALVRVVQGDRRGGFAEVQRRLQNDQDGVLHIVEKTLILTGKKK